MKWRAANMTVCHTSIAVATPSSFLETYARQTPRKQLKAKIRQKYRMDKKERKRWE